MKNKPARKKGKLCDPGLCDECLYIGEGDFVCERYIDDPARALVIDEFEPTENFLQCCKKGKADSTAR